MLRSVEYKNRIEMAPTSPKFTDAKGYLTTEHIDYFRAAARGGTGIITLGNCSIDIAHAQDEPRHVGLDNDDYLIELGRLADMFDRYGTVGLVEINHAGRDASPDYNTAPPMGPTAALLDREIQRAQLSGRAPIRSVEMTYFDIQDTIRRYADAAYRCKRAGFRHILIHGGHGNRAVHEPSFESPHRRIRRKP